MIHMYQVTYMDKRGAGCMRSFSSESDLNAFVRKLHCVATIYFDNQPIGEVWKATGEVDDRRVKWLWAYERMDT